jgi:hypothetical protein
VSYYTQFLEQELVKRSARFYRGATKSRAFGALDYTGKREQRERRPWVAPQKSVEH